MRAVVQRGYGAPADVLRMGEVRTPEPGPGEVLVKVEATSVHPDVWHVVAGRPHVLRVMGAGLRRPGDLVPGTDMAGVVAAVGDDVTRLVPGDRVFGETIAGMQWRNGGAWAEYVAVPEDNLAIRPAHVSAEQAACVATAGLIVLQNLPEGRRPGPRDRVLVNGAGGGVGSMALQVCRAWGALVTAVDHTDKLDLLSRLGADEVLDFTVDDFTATGRTWDLVFDIPGNHPYERVRRVLGDAGQYVLVGHDGFGDAGATLGSIPRVFALMARSARDPHLPRPDFSSPDRREAMEVLRGMLDRGEIAPVVAEVLPLERAVDALGVLAHGRPVGRVVLVP